MTTRRRFINALGLGALSAPLVIAQLGKVTRASAAPTVSAPGTWVMQPNTALASVVWRDAQNRTVNELKGAIAWYHSIGAWCGAAYRYDTDEMIIPLAGGDRDGASNEVWRAKFTDGTVHRDFNPTVDLIPQLGVRGPSYYVDTGGLYGRAGAVYPASRHTYNGLVHIPGTNLVWVAGGCPWAIAAGSFDVFLWDTLAHTWDWQSKDPIPHNDLGIAATWDSIGQRILFVDYQELWEWVPSRPVGHRARRLLEFRPDTFVQYRTPLFDARRNRLVMAGWDDNVHFRAQVTFWDMSTGRSGTLVSGNSGLLPTGQAPGFDFDFDNDRYLYTVQGDGLYWISAGTGVVMLEPTTGAPVPMVGWHGMFGRVRYSRNLNCVASIQDMYGGALTVTPRNRKTSFFLLGPAYAAGLPDALAAWGC